MIIQYIKGINGHYQIRAKIKGLSCFGCGYTVRDAITSVFISYQLKS